MIDLEARIEAIRREGSDPRTAVVLIDVVLGHGAHPDPRRSWASPAKRSRAALEVRASSRTCCSARTRIPRTEGASGAQLDDAGCLLAPTGARGVDGRRHRLPPPRRGRGDAVTLGPRVAILTYSTCDRAAA